MRDLAGFVLLLLGLLALSYLALGVLIPLLLKYFFGLCVFFLFAALVFVKGRRHIVHLDGLLQPQVAPMLALLAVLLPLSHALIAWISGAVDNFWLLWAINGALPILWTARTLFVHLHQKRRYISEGHDLEDLYDRARSREAALEVLGDALASVASRPVEQEPWEMAAGLEPLRVFEDPSACEKVQAEIREVRASYQEIMAKIRDALSEVQARGARTVERDTMAATLEDLERRFKEAKGKAEALLAESYAWAGVPWSEIEV